MKRSRLRKKSAAWRPVQRVAAVVALCLLAGLTVAACGDSDSDSSSGTAAESTTGASGGGAVTGKSIAIFEPTTTNAYTITVIKGATEAAEQNDASVDVFNSEYDGAKQASQISQAISSGKYDGLVIMPSAGPQTICSAVEKAIAAEIKVAMINQPACTEGTTQEEYSSALEGTSFTGWQAPELLEQYFRAGFEAEPNGGEYVVIAPPATHENYVRLEAALKAVEGEFPNWESAGFLAADYLPATALAKTSAVIQSNPDLNLLFGAYTEMTTASASALRSAGKLDQVSIVDWASESHGFEAIESGEYLAGFAALPFEEGYRGTQSVIAQITGKPDFEGVPAEGFVDLAKDPRIKPLGFEITKDNVAEFEAAGFPEEAESPDTLQIVNPF